MSDKWFRGESTSGIRSKAGGDPHDFGDGEYYTDRLEVAKLYAETRVAETGGQPRVVSVSVERSMLGRMLDLNANVRWSQYLKSSVVRGGATNEDLMRAANENYGRMFRTFARENAIDLRQYDTVVGPEFVRGGTQMCVLQKGAAPSALALSIRRLQQPVARSADVVTDKVRTIESPDLVTPRSPVRRMAGNQAAVALVGTLIAQAFETFGDMGIARRSRIEVEGRLAPGVDRILSSGLGVLVITTLEETDWADFNGVHMRSYSNTFIQGGRTIEDALETWRDEPKLMRAALQNNHMTEWYVWIPPR